MKWKRDNLWRTVSDTPRTDAFCTVAMVNRLSCFFYLYSGRHEGDCKLVHSIFNLIHFAWPKQVVHQTLDSLNICLAIKVALSFRPLSAFSSPFTCSPSRPTILRMNP